MRYASLLSGGKDSCLAHHLAAQTGFEPVVGIVVRPRDPDSYMFHVPNLDLAGAQVQAMGLDLVEVEAPPGKETETQVLEQAFEQARDRGAETIVSGAVASEYQRVRVEKAANRLDLVTHTPLWHKDPWKLLDEFVDGPWDVRVSAVAAMGFDETWLGRRIDDEARRDLRELNEEYGVHPIGEGGEYESVVLDAPFFESSIEVLDTESRFARDRGEWTVTDWRLQET